MEIINNQLHFPSQSRALLYQEQIYFLYLRLLVKTKGVSVPFQTAISKISYVSVLATYLTVEISAATSHIYSTSTSFESQTLQITTNYDLLERSDFDNHLTGCIGNIWVKGSNKGSNRCHETNVKLCFM